MISKVLNITGMFLAIILFQVMVLNNVVLYNFITPYFYPVFILLLPVNIPLWLLLIIGFGTGLTVDQFYNSAGIHAFATLFLAFVRPLILNVLTPRDGYEPEDKLTIKGLGFRWFFLYTLIAILIHHSVYFTIEVLSFSFPAYLLLKIILTSLFSILLIIISQFLFYPKKAKSLA